MAITLNKRGLVTKSVGYCPWKEKTNNYCGNHCWWPNQYPTHVVDIYNRSQIWSIFHCGDFPAMLSKKKVTKPVLLLNIKCFKSSLKEAMWPDVGNRTRLMILQEKSGYSLRKVMLILLNMSAYTSIHGAIQQLIHVARYLKIYMYNKYKTIHILVRATYK